MYARVRTISTGKAAGSHEPDDQGWSRFDEDSRDFPTVEAAREYIRDKYGKCKRVMMYRDSKDNPQGVHVGYIYCFHNGDWSHTPVEKWYQHDWVEITTVEESPVPRH